MHPLVELIAKHGLKKWEGFILENAKSCVRLSIKRAFRELEPEESSFGGAPYQLRMIDPPAPEYAGVWRQLCRIYFRDVAPVYPGLKDLPWDGFSILIEKNLSISAVHFFKAGESPLHPAFEVDDGDFEDTEDFPLRNPSAVSFHRAISLLSPYDLRVMDQIDVEGDLHKKYNQLFYDAFCLNAEPKEHISAFHMMFGHPMSHQDEVFDIVKEDFSYPPEAEMTLLLQLDADYDEDFWLMGGRAYYVFPGPVSGLADDPDISMTLQHG